MEVSDLDVEQEWVSLKIELKKAMGMLDDYWVKKGSLWILDEAEGERKSGGHVEVLNDCLLEPCCH